MEPDNPARGDQPARWVAAAILTAVMLVLTGVGLWLLILHIGEHRAGLTALIAFEHNPNADLRPGDAEDFHRAITDDWYVIAGYLLTLSACSVAYKLLAFSDRGKKLAPLLCGTLAVVGLADVVENLLVLHAIHHHAVDHRGPHLAIQVAATIKWSAFLVAALSFPLALACSVRLLKSYGAKWWTGRPASGTPWWHRVLAEVEETPGDPDGNQRAWRDAYRVPDVDPTKHSTALCLSGGGVRSACVAMGAMQIFSDSVATEPDTGEKAAKLDTFDYVISVSGGGYSAGARLLAVQSHPPNAQSSTRLSERFSPGSPEFDHLRRRSSYLADSVSRLLRALGEVVKNLLASLFILFSLAVLIGSAAGGFYAKVPLASFIPDRSPAEGSLASLQQHPVGAWVSIALLLGIAAIVAALALLAEWWSVRESFTVMQSRLSRVAKAVVCFGLITVGLTVALPGVMYLSSAVPVDTRDKVSTAGAFGGIATVTFVQLVATVISIVRGKDTGAQANEPKWWTKLLPRAVLQLAITLGTLLLLAITWLLVMGITGTQVFHFLTRPGNSLASVPAGLWYLTGILLLVMGYLWCCDVTSLSLHPFYRTRLARAFSVRRIDSKAVPYDKDEPTWLDEYGRCNPGPEFVFAAAAAVSDDTQPGPGQHAISFVMGADYIGSPALGWLKTSELRQIVPARIKRDLTVQAAVATSGAAFASTMGRQSTGLQTLFAASGARLGTWLPNPNFVLNARDSETKIAFPKALPSVRGAGYFYRELLQINNSDARLVQVTDGGHYENLGLVEALRRRCRLIYCIDGGGDTPPLLSGLSDAIRLAKNELGVDVIFDPLPRPKSEAETTSREPVPSPPADGQPEALAAVLDAGAPPATSPRRFAPDELAPGSAEPYPTAHPLECLNKRLTAGAVIRAVVHYPAAAGISGDTNGVLIFAKATLWKELPDWVLTHAAGKGNSAFPHDSTGNQWFNEAPFSAYVEVGRCIAAGSSPGTWCTTSSCDSSR